MMAGMQQLCARILEVVQMLRDEVSAMRTDIGEIRQDVRILKYILTGRCNRPIYIENGDTRSIIVVYRVDGDAPTQDVHATLASVPSYSDGGSVEQWKMVGKIPDNLRGLSVPDTLLSYPSVARGSSTTDE
jgi:hypothetical protein